MAGTFASICLRGCASSPLLPPPARTGTRTTAHISPVPCCLACTHYFVRPRPPSIHSPDSSTGVEIQSRRRAPTAASCPVEASRHPGPAPTAWRAVLTGLNTGEAAIPLYPHRPPAPALPVASPSPPASIGVRSQIGGWIATCNINSGTQSSPHLLLRFLVLPLVLDWIGEVDLSSDSWRVGAQ